MKLNIVLVEPEIPQNTGNIGRTCVALGASLHLVHPLGYTITDKQIRRAGLDYWNKLNLVHHENLESFLNSVNIQDCIFVSTKGKHCYSSIPINKECYLVFGKESAGLPEDLLRSYYDYTARIPMRDGNRSLNLSNAAAIMAYDIFRRWSFPDLQISGEIGGIHE
ncbi:MAG: tRNA (cytidine(34)-2'-O)-methyltransferase [Spirochaetaceae bacterium]|nr:MAG: tRNA (cytidine(34)-2'-O)-methyltransferase [Spirochaetaceae bacterium]